jgi:hypothetical protein
MTPNRLLLRRAATLVLLTLAACSRIMPAEPASTAEVTLGATGYRLDPAAIVAAELQGDLLRLDVQYGGGCARHRFQVHLQDGFLESDPVQARLQLSHDAGGDMCRALVGETLQFDLAPLRRAFEHAFPGARDLTLLVHEPGSATPVQPPLRYTLR